MNSGKDLVSYEPEKLLALIFSLHTQFLDWFGDVQLWAQRHSTATTSLSNLYKVYHKVKSP